MMHSAYKLNKQVTIYSLDVLLYLEPVCSSMSSSICCFLACVLVSQEASQVVWYSHLFQNFSQFTVIQTVKVFGIVNTEVDVFLELSCFFNDPADVGNLVSGSFAFSKTSLNIWKFMVHLFLEPGGLDGKESSCNAGDLDLIPELGRSPGEEKGYPIQWELNIHKHILTSQIIDFFHPNYLQLRFL